MFNKKFLEELFKPQELYSKKALRTVFDRLAHASIMRLNQASMDKVALLCIHNAAVLLNVSLLNLNFYFSTNISMHALDFSLLNLHIPLYHITCLQA